MLLVETTGLSERELQVLKEVAKGEPNKCIAGALGISIRTVQKHRQRIMSKTKCHSVVLLTHLAIKLELVEVIQ